MVVQHNLTAMNSNRMLGLTTASQAKATEKLSSGYKINRAADDAAGLAISEKMRKQIRGLTQASANAQDGISAVQTAEGALTEVHDMLQRMNELAVKTANGTMSESDRAAVQSEIDQLVTEIDRVSTTTKFNETYLLKGANGSVAGSLSYKTAENSKIGDLTSWDSTKGVATVAVISDKTLKVGTSATATVYSVQVGATVYVYVKGTSSSTISVTSAVGSINAMDVTSNAELSTLATTAQTKSGSSDAATTVKAFSSMDELMSAIRHDNNTDVRNVSSYYDTDAGTLTIKIDTFADLNDALNFSLHVGADSSDDNKINVNIAQMGARGLGINGLLVNGDNPDLATAAIDVIADALQKVSNQRATLGAVQNRLEHTINNLDNIVENTTSAESAIRDTDMATQMVEYSNNNILSQAGQAMLAQSNQTNQGVLSLLG